jgi:tetratricopeptide (TPR) repeat protein
VEPKRAKASDRAWLAQLYENDNKFELAKQQYLALLNSETPKSLHLAAYIEMLMRHDQWDEATSWLDKLEKSRPNDLGVVRLRVQWLHGLKKNEQIGPFVEPFAEKLLKKATGDPKREADACLQVGNLYMTTEQWAAAERWYRRLVELDPQRYEPMATVLSKQGRMRDAVEWCKKAAGTDHSGGPARMLAIILLAGTPSADDFAMAEPLLSEGILNYPNDTDLLASVASVRVVQKQMEEASRLYRAVLQRKPMDVATLNNLATLLGEQPDRRAEAIECVDRAIQIAGPQPGLLDTKGMILVFEGKADEAVSLLQEAAATPHSDPRYYFHYAVACDRVGDAAKARIAMEMARQGYLLQQVLTPSDRKLLLKMDEKY